MIAVFVPDARSPRNGSLVIDASGTAVHLAVAAGMQRVELEVSVHALVEALDTALADTRRRVALLDRDELHRDTSADKEPELALLDAEVQDPEPVRRADDAAQLLDEVIVLPRVERVVDAVADELPRDLGHESPSVETSHAFQRVGVVDDTVGAGSDTASVSPCAAVSDPGPPAN